MSSHPTGPGEADPQGLPMLETARVVDINTRIYAAGVYLGEQIAKTNFEAAYREFRDVLSKPMRESIDAIAESEAIQRYGIPGHPHGETIKRGLVFGFKFGLYLGLNHDNYTQHQLDSFENMRVVSEQFPERYGIDEIVRATTPLKETVFDALPKDELTMNPTSIDNEKQQFLFRTVAHIAANGAGLLVFKMPRSLSSRREAKKIQKALKAISKLDDNGLTLTGPLDDPRLE